MDLSASALNKMKSILETQLHYVALLGTYVSSVLQVGYKLMLGNRVQHFET